MTKLTTPACLLNPRSVAIIGASDDPGRIGGRPIASMRKQGFAGRILPVNPKRTEVQGLPAYASIEDLPEVPDVAIVAVPAPQVEGVVAALAARGVPAAILFSAGFAEVAGDGTAMQAAVVAAARRGGMRLLGPNSLGLANMHTGFIGTFSTFATISEPRPGRIGIVSQSGAYGSHLVMAAMEAGVYPSSIVMTGNECDLTVGDIVQLLVEDPNTDVIALYSEGINDGDGLVAALQAARAARKPVVMMKVGRSEVGGAAARSHTASIAGDDAVVSAVLEELGVVRVRDTEEMLDILRLAMRGVFPADNSLGVITVSGGAGVIISDTAEELGLPMPEMPAAAQARMLEMLPICSPRNPVDTTAQFINDPSLITPFTEAMVGEGGYRSVLGFFSYAAASPAVTDTLLAQIGEVRRRYPDRLYVVVARAPAPILARYEEAGFTVFGDPTRAVAAIAAMGRFGRAFAAGAPAAAPALAPVTLPAETPSEAQAKQLLADAGIASAPERACAEVQAAVVAAQQIGFPVVMKILSPDILHKSEIGGVLLDVRDEATVRSGFATLLERARAAAPGARIEGVLVAKQLSGGVECIMGINRDPVFGPIAMFGLGGVFVEVLKDVVFHRCPFGEDVAEQMIRSIKGAPLLLGARGRPVSDIAALAKMLSRLSAFAAAAGPRLQSVDLNPVFAMPEGQGVFAADAVVEVGQQGQ
ncbi:6-carboxyhexanoate-CoA ligase [Cupriavidus taiwanensis]|uniref:6-carboxyhexanoate-CoA ligase n=1 Tax=Cupriavidus taiwanensis TaxID=164546 RepID=A0A375E731_9BURK|nr:acetate--CoA ligase family protein [Cupriavidus taiwanensis]SOZ64509.1 6-carboxyhexanoate-CoA ligase [Cupriavidus taiwanensis]SOZ65239.1 6-carboxyhexanoate-CoA ligase [Cupriavidus taiwanensis]SOZ68857.1 6-carboxyhexanoate-CoA ligase [Cupriavidus taiwanensis]SPA08295.1 6-carboxyhexanoate-CoA ligase [Cupriavidus taiwanensis]